MKTVLIMMTIMMSTSVFADSRLTGDWCQIYDDFTEVMSIKQDGGFTIQTIGSIEQSKYYSSEGYISVPASESAFMVVDEVKTDISYSINKKAINFFKSKTILTIDKGNSGIEEYTKCSVKRVSDPVEQETDAEEGY